MKQTQEDLITPTPQEPIIIQQSGGSDKKFIYTLLILLVVLFIIALGVIVFLSSKFFTTQTPAQAPIAQNMPAKPISQSEKAAIQKALQVQIAQKQNTTTSTQATNTGALEALLQENEQTEQKQSTQNTQTKQIIAQTAQAAGKTLTQADIEKIAKLVAAQLAKTKSMPAKSNTSTQAQNTQTQNPATASAEDQNLVASLQNAAVDTLQEQELSTSNVNSNVQAKQQANKKVDTFNKVIVQNNNSEEDEFSKLTKEIDSILQETQTSSNSETISALRKEAKTHAKELRFIVVKPGDTLGSIARRVYGRASAYVKIYKANPHLIKNPDKIYVGMKLRVPVDDEYKGR